MGEDPEKNAEQTPDKYQVGKKTTSFGSKNWPAEPRTARRSSRDQDKVEFWLIQKIKTRALLFELKNGEILKSDLPKALNLHGLVSVSELMQKVTIEIRVLNSLTIDVEVAT